MGTFSAMIGEVLLFTGIPQGTRLEKSGGDAKFLDATGENHMESHGKVIEQMKVLREESNQLLDAGQVDDALVKVDQALALEENNQKSLTLKADILEKKGESKEAETLRAQVKLIKNEAWKKKVEAEARGQHEVMGVRNE